MLPEPPLHPGGRGTRSQRPCRDHNACPKGEGAQRRAPDRPHARLGPEVRSPRGLVRPLRKDGRGRRFEQFTRERGKVLDGYTSFCLLAERFGLPWQDWPAEYRHPETPTWPSGCEPGRPVPQALPRLAPVAVRSAACEASERWPPFVRPCRRRGRGRRRRLVLAGSVRPRYAGRGAARRVQHDRARTGGLRHGTRGSSAPPPTSPSSRPCGQCCDRHPGFGSTT